VNPFRYSKEEMLQVWKDGGGCGGLGLEVELWEGVVREIGGEPAGLREMGEGERKVCSELSSRPRDPATQWHFHTRLFLVTRPLRACSCSLFLLIRTCDDANHTTSCQLSLSRRAIGPSFRTRVPVLIVPWLSSAMVP
jgi:hypothetical protein